MIENLKKAIGLFKGARKEVADRVGIQPINVDRALKGDFKNEQVEKTAVEVVEERIKEAEILIEPFKKEQAAIAA